MARDDGSSWPAAWRVYNLGGGQLLNEGLLFDLGEAYDDAFPVVRCGSSLGGGPVHGHAGRPRPVREGGPPMVATILCHLPAGHDGECVQGAYLTASFWSERS